MCGRVGSFRRLTTISYFIEIIDYDFAQLLNWVVHVIQPTLPFEISYYPWMDQTITDQFMEFFQFEMGKCKWPPPPTTKRFIAEISLAITPKNHKYNYIKKSPPKVPE